MSESIVSRHWDDGITVFGRLYDYLALQLYENGIGVDTGHWQAITDVPQTKTVELRNVVFNYDLPAMDVQLANDVKPNLPWAEDHFQERVGGVPTNPGEQYMNWPFWRGGHRKEGQFSHTYQERFWPKQAGSDFLEKRGIRYRYGDLNDVIDLLGRQPYTRQAFLPVWFPEDTGAHHGERVPCTLGYHFLLREGKFHITYLIRSVDLLRHFRDDVFMAGRLCQWVLSKLLTEYDPADSQWMWDEVEVGTLTMHMMSLHVFEGDMPRLKKELNG